MLQNLAEMLSYPFMVRALTVGILLSLCAALLGVSLVLVMVQIRRGVWKA